jgi:hypothetical protein
MVKVLGNRICTVSILIQWTDGDNIQEEDAVGSLKADVPVQGRQKKEAKARSGQRADMLSLVPRPGITPRLLSTDRIVLAALHQRVPQGKTVTPAVSIKELVAECVISRRQVQICLKRLIEKGLIKRISEGLNLGSQKGYRYQISRDVIHW